MRVFSRYLMVVFYVLAGINHFLHPEFYLQIMPQWVPAQLAMVYISGACEILGGMLLLSDKTLRAGAWSIIVLLIAVFPANIQMEMDFYREHNHNLWIAIARLPLQFVLIWWAWLFARRRVITV